MKLLTHKTNIMSNVDSITWKQQKVSARINASINKGALLSGVQGLGQQGVYYSMAFTLALRQMSPASHSGPKS